MDFVMGTAVSRKDFDGYFEEYDKNNNEVYSEDSNGYLAKRTYDENNNQVYYEDSDGYWAKRAYDKNNNAVYYENSNGYWSKRTYDKNNNMVYFEDSGGYWSKRTYDKNNNQVYWENSRGDYWGTKPEETLFIENATLNTDWQVQPQSLKIMSGDKYIEFNLVTWEATGDLPPTEAGKKFVDSIAVEGQTYVGKIDQLNVKVSELEHEVEYLRALLSSFSGA